VEWRFAWVLQSEKPVEEPEADHCFTEEEASANAGGINRPNERLVKKPTSLYYEETKDGKTFIRH
jgi:hypothetical protein